jgi:hypothetical protein
MPGVVTGDLPLNSDYVFDGSERWRVDTENTRGINPQSPVVDLNMVKTWLAEEFGAGAWTTVELGLATEGQTVFTVTGGYTANYLKVYVNGVRQVVGTDVTASNGTTITFASGLTAGDIVTLDKVAPFTVADTIRLSDVSALSLLLLTKSTQSAWRQTLGATEAGENFWTAATVQAQADILSLGVMASQPIVYSTRGVAAAATVPAGRTSMIVLGYNTTSDAPPAKYVEVADTGTLYSWQFRSNGNTRRWQLVERSPDVRHFGPTLGFGADCSLQIQNCIDYVEAVWGNGTIRGAGAWCLISNPLRISNSGVTLEGDPGNKLVLRRGANNGALLTVGRLDGTAIARSGLLHCAVQDLTGVGVWANSPYGVVFSNVNEAKFDNNQLYNETMGWFGVVLSWVGTWEIFWDGAKDYSANGVAWTVSASSGTGARASGAIWANGFFNMECGTIAGGGATITPKIKHGILVEQCDGLEMAGHIQACGGAAVLMQAALAYSHRLYNIHFKDLFIDLSAARGIETQGDDTIVGVDGRVKISHRGLGGSAISRYGVLWNCPMTEFDLEIVHGDGTMRDLVLFNNASIDNGHIKISMGKNVGVETSNTYSFVNIAGGTRIHVTLGSLDGNTVARYGVVFGGSAVDCSVSGGRIDRCTYGVWFGGGSTRCTMSGVDVSRCTTPHLLDGGAVSAASRGCRGVVDFG